MTENNATNSTTTSDPSSRKCNLATRSIEYHDVCRARWQDNTYITWGPSKCYRRGI